MVNYFLRPKGFGKKSCQGIAEKMSYEIEVLLNGSYEPVEANLLIRWGCTASFKENGSTRLLEANTSRGIKEVSDKAASRKLLADAGLAPRTWSNYLEVPFGVSVVVRPSHHKQGKELYVCQNGMELLDATEACGIDYYISEFIDKVKEYRVLVFQGRVLFVYEKIPEDPSKIAWNHAQGATTPNVKWSQWNLDVCSVAVDAMTYFDDELTFGAVDVIVDKQGRAYVLEINTAPETTSEYRQTCFAKAFDYLIEGHEHDVNIKAPSWKYFIHPAISENAVCA